MEDTGSLRWGRKIIRKMPTHIMWEKAKIKRKDSEKNREVSVNICENVDTCLKISLVLLPCSK